MLKSVFDRAGTSYKLTNPSTVYSLENKTVSKIPYKSEQCVCHYLDQHHFIYYHSYTPKWLLGLHLDFFIKVPKSKYDIGIEYDGPTHFRKIYTEQVRRSQLRNDLTKNRLCKKHHVKLIRIDGNEASNKSEYYKIINKCLNKHLLPLVSKKYRMRRTKESNKKQAVLLCKVAIKQHKFIFPLDRLYESNSDNRPYIWLFMSQSRGFKYLHHIFLERSKRLHFIDPTGFSLFHKMCLIVLDHPYFYLCDSSDDKCVLTPARNFRTEVLARKLVADHDLRYDKCISLYNNSTIKSIIDYNAPVSRDYFISCSDRILDTQLKNTSETIAQYARHLARVDESLIAGMSSESSHNQVINISICIWTGVISYMLAFPTLVAFNRNNHHIYITKPSIVKRLMLNINGYVLSHKNMYTYESDGSVAHKNVRSCDHATYQSHDEIRGTASVKELVTWSPKSIRKY